MKISITEVKTPTFPDLEIGDVFKYNGCIYIKIAEVGSVGPNHFNLTENRVDEYNFVPGCIVTKYKASMKIKRC